MTANEFKNMISKYQRPLLSVIQKMVHSHEIARDMLQESFLRFWKKYQDDRFSGSVFSLLYRIAMNLAIDHLRKQNSFPLSYNDSFQDPGYVPGDYSELYQIILKCAAQLKPRQKAAFVLRDIEGLDFDEISQILTLPVENIRSNLYLARKNIKNLLEVNYDINQEFFYEL
jgi:RNA polymerase sigma-70 factor (ECF subfamily)